MKTCKKDNLMTIRLRIWLMCGVVLFASALSNTVWAQASPAQKGLTLALATKAAMAAVHQCLDNGFKVSVAIVDHSGLLKVQLKADGAGPHTLDSSFRKAYTSNSLRGPTQRFAVLTVNNPELRALGQMNEKILLLGGGFPITMNGEVVGGVGVGGAPGIEHDEVCAEAALKVLNPE